MTLTEAPAVTVALSQSLESPCPPPTPVVENLIDRGEIAVIAAGPGTGKTPFVTQLVACVAAGVPFLDLKSHQGTVVAVDTESQAGQLLPMMRKQWDALGGESVTCLTKENVRLFVRGLPDDPNCRELKRVMRGSIDTRFRWLAGIGKSEAPALISIDTLLTFAPCKSSDEERIREMFAVLADIRDGASRPAIAVTVHLRKRDRRARMPKLSEDPYGWTEEILGSVVWSTSADVRLGMERVGENEVVVAGYRRGLGIVNPIVIGSRIDDEGEPVLWETRGIQNLMLQTFPRRQTAHFLGIPVGVPQTYSDLLRIVGSKGSLNRLMERAIDTGLLSKQDDGRYVRHV